MTGDSTFSPNDEVFLPNSELDITIEEGSQNSERLLEDEGDDLDNEHEELFEFEGDNHENDGDDTIIIDGHQNDENDTTIIDGHENEGDDTNIIDGYEGNNQGNKRDNTIIVDDQNGASQGKDYPPPVMGMGFESYDDAYNYYNCYAKELGFAIRVKSSWTKRNSKEKRGAVLCCNCEGFKTTKEANTRRKETRTGCLAMIRLRLVESNRWRVDEVKLDHNHSFDPERAQNSKSHKRVDVGAKRKVDPIDVEVRTIKLYRTPVIDALGCGNSNSEGEPNSHVYCSGRLKLKKGDAQVIYSFFSHVQLTNPNFFYVMDLNDEGHLRNVFWIDSRSRAAYSYFGDVVAFDTTCLSGNFEIPLFSFVGVNHHGQSIFLGCGLLADETLETYVWLFRAWLTSMCGRPPQAIITNQCKAIQVAIAEVFPRAHHRLCLSLVMESILMNLMGLQDHEAFQMVLSRIIYNSVKGEEFEAAWEDMIQRFGLKDHEWLRDLFEDRERWAPVYVKDTFFAGMSNFDNNESLSPFFDGYIHQQTSLEEFFNEYELILQKQHQKESLDDFDSNNWIPVLKSSCYCELQLSKLYTKEIFSRFQDEVVLMSSCFSIGQVHTNGPIVTYLVKEREGEEILRDVRNYEVVYDKSVSEVRCICGCFNLKGYLCRHALCVLNYDGVEEIPIQYILRRWRKDFKRLYVPDLGSNVVDITNPVQWVEHLYRRAMQVVEEGMASQDHYMVAWQAFKESLNKVRLVADKHV